MKFEKRFKKDLAKIETPDIEKIIPGAASKHTESRAPRARKRLSAAAVAIILCCCMVLGRTRYTNSAQSMVAISKGSPQKSSPFCQPPSSRAMGAAAPAPTAVPRLTQAV